MKPQWLILPLTLLLALIWAPPLAVGATKPQKDSFSVANIQEVHANQYDIEFMVRHDRKANDLVFDSMTVNIELERYKGVMPTKIKLDTTDLQILEAKFVGSEESIKRKSITRNEKAASGKSIQQVVGVSFTIPQALRKQDKWQLLIQYKLAKGKARWLFEGVSRRTGYPFAFTQLEPTGARGVFPSQDSPLIRSHFSTRVIINGRRIGAWATGMKQEAKKSNHHYYISESPIPTYLYAFAIGRFREHEDRGITVVGEKRGRSFKAMVGEVIQSFEDSREYYERILDHKLPYKQLKVFLAPDAYNYGGMENQAFIFLAGALATKDGLAIRKGLIPHELVHHWFGNILMLSSWSDISVNEGPTSYYHQRYLEDRYGVNPLAASWLRMLNESSRERYNVERDSKSGHLTYRWNRDEEAENFSDYYDKSSWIHREAEYFVGKEAMDRALSGMLKPGFRNVSVKQFYRELGKRLSKDKKTKRLQRFPTGGLANHLVALAAVPGMPYLQVTCKDKNQDGILESVRIRQKGHTYALGRVPAVSYGSSGSKTWLINLDKKRTADIDLKGQKISALFIDPEAKRWISTTHCFDSDSKAALYDVTSNLKPEVVRVQDELVRHVGQRVFRMVNNLKKNMNQEELDRYPRSFRIGLMAATGENVFDQIQSLLKKALKKEKYEDAYALVDLAGKLELPAEHRLVKDLRKLATNKSLTAVTNSACGPLGTLEEEQMFLIDALTDQFQHQAFTVTRVCLNRWLSGEKSAAKNNAKVVKELQTRIDDKRINNRFVLTTLGYWLKNQQVTQPSDV